MGNGSDVNYRRCPVKKDLKVVVFEQDALST